MNSNLGVTNRRVKQFSEKVAKLLKEGKIKSFRLYTSIDSWGPQAEYMRRGLDCKVWEQNLDTYLTITGARTSLMITYNVLVVAYFRQLLEKIEELRKKYNTDDGVQRIDIDTPYLKEPPHWMMNILPLEYGKYLDDDLQYIKDNIRTDRNDLTKFHEYEYEKYKRVRDYFYEGGQKITDDLRERGRRDFYVFFNEYDKRSDLDFAKTFPRYSEFMKLCKETYEQYKP